MRPPSSKKFSKKSRFFQPLVPNFKTNFVIPKSFHTHLQVDETNRDKRKCVILYDSKSTQPWFIEVEFPRFNFKSGWEIFCEDHNLQIGDFVVFKHQGNWVFDVLIYDPSGCEREFPAFDVDLSKAKVKPSKIPRDCDIGTSRDYIKGLEMMGNEEDPKSTVTFEPTRRPYFRDVVNKTSLASGDIEIPREIAYEIGIGRRRFNFMLVDEEGKQWKMGLRYSLKCQKHYIYRWPSLYKAYGLKIGQSVGFELIKSNGNTNTTMKFYSK
ncbi:hypothetical protein BVRB_1g007440 [Beta vulgaris subsp. vulgaris]|nr:hypothetical protein BVRB_1g007440 [Beta vulgaris subsp. vulgaris]